MTFSLELISTEFKLAVSLFASTAASTWEVIPNALLSIKALAAAVPPAKAPKAVIPFNAARVLALTAFSLFSFRLLSFSSFLMASLAFAEKWTILFTCLSFLDFDIFHQLPMLAFK